MKTFRYTILTVNLIRRHAKARHSIASIARLMDCLPSTIETICKKHGIEIGAGDAPSPSIAPHAAPDVPFVHPLLDPARRRARNNLTGIKLEIANGALGVIEREAARRGTTPSVLIARMAELIAQDGMFAAVLD